MRFHKSHVTKRRLSTGFARNESQDSLETNQRPVLFGQIKIRPVNMIKDLYEEFYITPPKIKPPNKGVFHK